jgi:hypothetical protein
VGQPLEVSWFTAAGEIRQVWSEEEVERMPSMRGVIEPTEGRPRLAAALLFQLQSELARAEEFFTVIDKGGSACTFRASAVYGVRVLEPLDPAARLPRIGYQPKGE